MGVAPSSGSLNDQVITQTNAQMGVQTPPPQMPQISRAQAEMPHAIPFYNDVRYLNLFVLLLACIIVYLLVAGNPYSSGADTNASSYSTGLPVK